MTLLITILLLITIRPVDGGNHPRKDGVRQPVSTINKLAEPVGFHPPKSFDQ